MPSEKNNNNLRKLREDKGLSLESVASQLKLTAEVIKKLETSDFESLGAYTYVRGYLNHYARLLDVDAQPYVDLIPKSTVPLVNTKSNNSSTIKFKRQSKNFLSYAIGTFVVVAVSFSGYYLLKNYTNPSKNSVEIVQPSDLDILPITQSIDTNKAETDGKENDSFHYSSIIPTDVVKDSSEDVSLDSKVDQESEPTIDSQNLMPESIMDETVTETANSIEDPIALYNIIINASETSWVKVENSDGKKLHNDLLKPGSISLSSDKPVHFRIGNEKKVKVTINGEEINISDYASKDIADFNWPFDV
jgi:cytoskeleton protein RodZ